MNPIRQEYLNTRQRIKPIVFARFNNTCANCDSNDNLQMHHAVPMQFGGSNKIENIVLLCGDCHGVVHGRKNAILANGRPKTLNYTKSEVMEILAEGKLKRKGVEALIPVHYNTFKYEVWRYFKDLTQARAETFASRIDELGLSVEEGARYFGITVTTAKKYSSLMEAV